MLYDYQYDVAAVAVTLMIFAVFIIRRSYITKANRIFLIIIICNLVTAVCDAISSFTVSYPHKYPLELNYGVTYGYLFFYNMMSVLFFVYVDSRARIGKFQKPVKFVAGASIVFYAVTIVSSPWTHWVSYFDKNRVYSHGPVMYIFYVIPYLVFVWEAIMFCKARSKFNRYQILASVMLIVGMSISVLISIIFPKLSVGPLGMSVVMIFVYIAYENPAYYTYKDTQCLNRKAFYETVRKMIRRNENFHVVAFTFQDYEYSRHSMGSRYIERISLHVADLIYTHFKKDAFCITDDKFAIVVRENELDQQHIERLRELFKKPIRLEDSEITVHVIIRTLLNMDNRFEPEDIEDLVGHRLTHLEDKTGAHDIMKSVLDKKNRREKIVHIIKRALKNNEFQVYYQPIFNTNTNRVESAEALLRMYDEEMGFLNPEELITIAEETGYIDQIGDVIFQKICQFIQESDIRKLGISYIEINLSPVQGMKSDLVDNFQATMQVYRIDPSWINFEITETARMADESQIFKNIQTLNKMGVEFSIDDYGSGFAAADYLIKLPVSIVKIDKGILWMAMKEPGAMIVLKNTIRMLKEMGKEIVVEGVETAEMVQILTSYGCDFLQGYYFSKPIPKDEFVDYMRKRRFLNE